MASMGESSLSVYQIERASAIFATMKQMISDGSQYSEIPNTMRIRNPENRICRLLNVTKIEDIVSESLLFEAIVRIVQIEREDLTPIDHVHTGMLPNPDNGLFCSTRITHTVSNGLEGNPKNKAQSHRPDGLSTLLQIVAQCESQGDRKYLKFLHLARSSQQEINQSCVAILTSYTNATAELDKKSIHNSTLLEIFSSYSGVSSYSRRVTDMDDGMNTRYATIHIHEFFRFCEEFEVCPRLLSRKEVKTIWTAVSLRADKNSTGWPRGLELDDFKDALVRIALLTYHKKSAKQLILKLNDGIMSSHSELLGYLCRYLHLDDHIWVTKHLQAKILQLKKLDVCTFGNTDVKAVASKTKCSLSEGARMGTLEGSGVQSLPFLKERARVHRDLKEITLPDEKRIALPSSVESLFCTMRSDTALIACNDGEEANTANIFIRPSRIDNGDMTAEQSHLISSDFSPEVLRCFDKYCRRSRGPVDSSSGWVHSGGGFIDMGNLKEGAQCVIKLKILNKSSDEVYIDTACRGFESSDVRVITEPSAVIPGMTRTVKALFTVESGDRSVVGRIEVFVACVRTSLSYSVQCPVHYRVGLPNPDRDDYPCTTRNISQLLSASTGEKHIEVLNFERKRFNKTESQRNLRGLSTNSVTVSRSENDDFLLSRSTL